LMVSMGFTPRVIFFSRAHAAFGNEWLQIVER